MNVCPICHKRDTFYKDKKDGANVLRCNYCSDTTIINMNFMHHQLRFIHDKESIKSILGGYGSGKTTVGAIALLLKACSVSSKLSLVVANTVDQLIGTSYKELRSFLPASIVKGGSIPEIKKGGTIKLVNDHEIIYTASNNPETIKSYNAVHIHMEEANGINEEIYKELNARLRNAKGKIGMIDYEDKEDVDLQIVTTSNPADSYVLHEIVGRTPLNKLQNYTKEQIPISGKGFSNHLSTQVVTTAMNIYLGEDYMERLKDTLSEIEYKTMVEGSLKYLSGRIVENVEDLILDLEPVKTKPNYFYKIYGLDFGAGGGSGDAQGLIEVYIALNENVIYVVNEDRIDDNMSIDEKVSKYTKNNGIINYDDKFLGIFYDKIHGNKRSGLNSVDAINTTIAQMYKRKGLKGLLGARNAEFGQLERVAILTSIIKKGNLYIDKNCVELIAELRGWNWNEKTGKPVDKDNHMIDGLMFILLELFSIISGEINLADYVSNNKYRLYNDGYSNENNYNVSSHIIDRYKRR